MIQNVRFAGLKSLLDVRVDLERFTVLVGPNGCGKSTVLDGIELAVEATRWDAALPNIFSRAGELIKAQGADRLRTQISSVPLVLEAGGTEGNMFRLTVAPGPAIRWYEGTTLEAVTPKGAFTVGYSTSPSERQAFGEHLVASFNWRAQRLALMPRAIAARSDVMVNELRFDGYGLPTVLRDLAANHPDVYKVLLDDMSKTIQHFRGVKWTKAIRTPDDPALSPTPLATLHLVMTNGTIPASDCSDGTLLALATLTAIHHPDLPGLVLIDDVDHGLHLGAQYQLMQAIRRKMESRAELQVICTTHSPVLVDAFEPGEVRVMRLDASGYTHCRPLTEAPEYARWRRGLQAGELWASLGEDWVNGDHAD